MLSLVITIAMLLLAFLVWIIVINTSKSKQTALPLLLIHEGFGPHFVECYIIKNGVCVASGHIDVPIGHS